MKAHPQALVESNSIGEGTRIWAFAHVLAGASIGCNGNIGDHAFIEGGAVIGNNVTVKNQVCVWNGVVIEDDAFIGPRVTFTNDLRPRSPRMPEVGERYSTEQNWLVKTTVRRGCSIGAAAVICPGVELGAYSMVAAGAVVTKDVPPFALCMGSPAVHRADVCVCGEKLAGSYRTSDCRHCGQTAAQRQQRLEELLA